MDLEDCEEETYIQHLRSMFNELDADEKGGLNKEQMRELSEKLSLQQNQSDLLLQLSFGSEDSDSLHSTEDDVEKDHVDFDKFQECFVAVLSATTELPMSCSDSDEEPQEIQEAEPEKPKEEEPSEKPGVKPTVVHKGKSYGRRSQPDVFESDEDKSPDKSTKREMSDIGRASDSEDNEVFDNGFHELPDRNSRVYFEASGQLQHPTIARLRQKSSSNLSSDNQANLSISSITHEHQHLFGTLDKDDLGYIGSSDLYDMWKKEGVTDPQHVLQVLDVSIDSDKQVNAHDLTSTLENEALALGISSSDSILKAVMATYKHQITHLNGQVEQQQIVLGKMKEDLEKSEVRNTKLIDEVDDRYLNVDKSKEQILSNAERQWSKKLRQAKRNFEKDREHIQAQAMREHDALQQEIDRLMIREGSLRSTINALQLDNEALEQDTKDLVEKLQSSEKNAARLQRDLECLLNEKAVGSHDQYNASQEERFAAIIKDYEAQCRSLSDRNDELVAELEKIRSEFLQAMRKRSEQDADSDEDVRSEGKGCSRKRGRRSTLSEYIDNPNSDDEDEGRENRSKLHKKIEQLETITCELREEKTKMTTRFAEEKSILRSQLESEFRSKLEEERKKLVSFQEMTKSDKNSTINQALADGRKQREELERKISELEKTLDAERMTGQESISNLCREFESDKTELQHRHEEELKEFHGRISDTQHELQESKKAHEVTAQQLQTERSQHEAAMQAHSATISQLEKNLRKTDSQENTELLKLKAELEETILRHEKEKRNTVARHSRELETVREEMQKKIDDILADKQQQDRDSISNELERMHGTVVAERKDMQHRITELKKAFDLEAEELRTLVEVEKNELRRQLGEETASLRKKLTEEAEKELEKRRKRMEEENNAERDSQIRHLEEIIKNLQKSKSDLEEQLEESVAANKNLEKSNRESERLSQGGTDAVSRLETALNEKDKLNELLQSQIDDLRKDQIEKTGELMHVKTQYDMKMAELSQLIKEKQDMANKVLMLETEKSSYQINNARLNARNIELGKNEVENESEKDKEIVKLKAKVAAKEEICSQLRLKLKKMAEPDVAPRQVPVSPRTPDLKSRHDETRSQLMIQMKKTKDLYSMVARSEGMIKDLYCENAQLLRALAATEERQKASERRTAIESDKNLALTSLLRKICPEAV